MCHAFEKESAPKRPSIPGNSAPSINSDTASVKRVSPKVVSYSAFLKISPVP